jgi:hypothetical protein
MFPPLHLSNSPHTQASTANTLHCTLFTATATAIFRASKLPAARARSTTAVGGERDAVAARGDALGLDHGVGGRSRSLLRGVSLVERHGLVQGIVADVGGEAKLLTCATALGHAVHQQRVGLVALVGIRVGALVAGGLGITGGNNHANVILHR